MYLIQINQYIHVYNTNQNLNFNLVTSSHFLPKTGSHVAQAGLELARKPKTILARQ